MPACGKTTLGKEVAKRLGMPFIDFDAEIEREAKMTIPELFRSRGEGAFRQIESEIAQRFGNGNGYVLSVGGGTPITKENRNALKRNGIVFYVQRDLDKLITEGRPLSQKEGVESLFQKRDAYYRSGCDFIVKNNTVVDTAVEEIITTYEKNIGY
jgi:shikimate dehydrogenase